jgi:nicotinamide-nucleotide amidase
MKAEIVMIGTELLLGQITDTNATYLARQLTVLGIDLFRKTTIGDNTDRIAHVLERALSRCDVVITSGGIGPTVDDKTREAVARATGKKLELIPKLLGQIEDFFKRRGMELGENNKRQAFIPEGAIPIENPVGTAPGFIVEQGAGSIISLPGVPRELYYLTENVVIPYLKRKFNIDKIIKIRVLRTAGIGESTIDRMIEDLEECDNPTVGLSAHPGSVDIRVSAKAESEAHAAGMLDEMEAKIRSRVGDSIYGIDGASIEQVVVDLLAQQGLTLALLETNTGGVFASRFTEPPKGLPLLKAAFVHPYRNCPQSLFTGSADSGDSSKLPVDMLAEKLRETSGASVALAIVGDEDPNVGPFQKVTGETHIGISSPAATERFSIQLGGITRDARIRITNFAFEKLRRYLTLSDA